MGHFLDSPGQIAVDDVGNTYLAGNGSGNAFKIAPDCNNNGVPDLDDIASVTSPDCNNNGIPDECEPDSDGDGAIDGCDACPNDPAKTDPAGEVQCSGRVIEPT